MKYPLLGPFVPIIPHPGYLLKAAKTAVEDDGNTFMVYSDDPDYIEPDVNSPKDVENLDKFWADNGLSTKTLVAHAPFIMNIANPINEKTWHFSVNILEKELSFCERIGLPILVVHSGSYVQGTVQQGLDRIVRALNQVADKKYSVKIALETMSGKGTEVGITFEQFKYIFDHLDSKVNVGLCLDTCHLNDAGYDIGDWDSVKAEIAKNVGLDKVYCIHLNDSKNAKGSHKDRHANIGYGTIGFDNLVRVAWDETFKDVPKILETPWVDNHAYYKEEIADLRQKKFTNYLD
ncbi:endonuclease IV [Entomoplasma freundtii]|uniref:Probable endonuclease 4 n=1 Tax=Entomoplasma freundtii TaxID=74700 RepID=A0A2K8NR69_9MOLU|nr:deoxyribonuclease IV [Entomoplasma freundtii]ATZ16345.1 endonuclease IV [Entomoplasma freundtii]TDY56616.1 endonuclease IV [Entomoplasma freundtii]